MLHVLLTRCCPQVVKQDGDKPAIEVTFKNETKQFTPEASLRSAVQALR
jgi:hypothetical protein